jgi:iron(III) transport system permease protein
MPEGGRLTIAPALAAGATRGSQVASGWRGKRFAISWVGAAALLVSFMALVPLGFVVSATLEAGWTEVAALIWRPRVGELLINTALLMGSRRRFALSWASGWLSSPSERICLVIGFGA